MLCWKAPRSRTRLRPSSARRIVPNQDLQYVYDAAGNRDYTVLNGVRTEYTADNANAYTDVGGVAQQHDADGNLIFDGEITYTYDALGRLVRAAGPHGVT